MYVHEHQAKEILARRGVAVPRGRLVSSARDTRVAAEELGGEAVVKAQIHAGGRGKAGGIRVAPSPEEAAALYERMIGSRLVTGQTGPSGRRVRRVYLEERLSADRELYAALSVDRGSGRVVIRASGDGGMDVEGKGAMSSITVDPAMGPAAFALRDLAAGIGLSGSLAASFSSMATMLYDAFVGLDCSLIEINPLAVVGERVVALDAKMAFDDNALYRHPDIAELRDIEEEETEEFEALKYGLSYVKLDGSVGCLVNGAGLAMATLDAVTAAGGLPANFLDLGGGASEEAVRRAFELLAEDGRAKAALVNVFGGIVRCDAVARGVKAAIAATGTGIPVVVRFAGNRAAEGRAEMAALGARARFASSLQEAAAMAVETAGAR